MHVLTIFLREVIFCIPEKKNNNDNWNFNSNNF